MKVKNANEMDVLRAENAALRAENTALKGGMRGRR
jgi:cell division protein FtsB